MSGKVLRDWRRRQRIDQRSIARVRAEADSLNSSLLEAHTEKVVALPPDAFGVLMRTLHFGLSSADANVLSDSLEATTALATFNYNSLLKGGAGLGGNAMCALRDAAGPEPVLQRFMHLILERLLFGASEAASVAGEAAGPLLPLILAEHAAFEAALGQVLHSQGDPGRRNVLHAAAQALVAPLRDAGERLGELETNAMDQIRANPFQAVGIAAAAGFLIGYLGSRR